MNNPYEVLGISPNATDEEVKHAYRELAKKYHPDNYADNPLSDLAEQKMKEINAAYDEICESRKNGQQSSSYSSSGYTSTSFPDVRKLIMEGRLDDAAELLNGVSDDRRNAEWYFLMGMVYSRRGWSDQAFNYFQRAHNMDPDNAEYSAMLNNMNNRRTNFNPGYNTAGNGSDCSCCDICAAVYCTNCLCNCARGC
ncbi:MAG: DnaJ domain-containing protein [Ruminococcus sp.]|nr:DnaJ domain-containing protein [Ruminococcus sp.]